jgi:hypothetical protein
MSGSGYNRRSKFYFDVPKLKWFKPGDGSTKDIEYLVDETELEMSIAKEKLNKNLALESQQAQVGDSTYIYS